MARRRANRRPALHRRRRLRIPRRVPDRASGGGDRHGRPQGPRRRAAPQLHAPRGLPVAVAHADAARLGEGRPQGAGQARDHRDVGPRDGRARHADGGKPAPRLGRGVRAAAGIGARRPVRGSRRPFAEGRTAGFGGAKGARASKGCRSRTSTPRRRSARWRCGSAAPRPSRSSTRPASTISRRGSAGCASPRRRSRCCRSTRWRGCSGSRPISPTRISPATCRGSTR